MADSENPSHHYYDCDVDLISSLPDEIIQHILSFIETKFAIRTSVLSRRWKHICWSIHSLYFDFCTSISKTTELINKTLIRYKAVKFFSIYIRTWPVVNAAEIDSWIEFAMSRNAEKLSLDFLIAIPSEYNLPDLFYFNSSLKQLSLNLGYYNMIPRYNMIPKCTVSWTSLKNLSLGYCKLPDESAAQILSGSPVLESLTLTSCHQLEFLDLSKSLLLRRLDITCLDWTTKSMVIIAPHIHYLRLKNSQPSTLVDASSLIEADLRFWHLSRLSLTTLHVDFKNMLAKLHNVNKLTFDAVFLQVETLTLEINIFRSDLTGITKMLQNSHELKKITIHIKKITKHVSRSLLNNLDTKGLNEYQFWRLKHDIFQTPLDTMDMEAEAKFVLWLVKSLLGNTKTVQTIVVLLRSQVSERVFNELVQMVPTLHSEVSIVLKRSDD